MIKNKKIILIIFVFLLLLFLNPFSLYFLYGSSRIITGIAIDLITAKKETYLNKCDIKKMSCEIEIEKEKNFSDCEYENTKNCKCYECLNNLDFDSCSQCYMPQTQESFCIIKECNISAFP